MRVPALLLLLGACDGTGSFTVGDGESDVTDTTTGGGGGGGGNNGGGGGGNNGGDTTDTTDTTDTDVGGGAADPFGSDPLAWDGKRTFTFVPYTGRPCSLTATETGEQVYGAGYLQMERACPACQRVFTVPAEIRGLCVTSLSSPTTYYRGLEFLGGGQVRIWSLTQSGAKWSADVLATGTLAGDKLSYAYKSSELGYKRVDVVGEVTLD